MNNVENKVANIKHRVEDIYDYQIDLDYVEQKLIDLEDRSRRSNLKVDGILETPGETWDDCKEKLQQDFLAQNALLKPNEHIERQADKIIRTMVTTQEQLYVIC